MTKKYSPMACQVCGRHIAWRNPTKRWIHVNAEPLCKGDPRSGKLDKTGRVKR